MICAMQDQQRHVVALSSVFLVRTGGMTVLSSSARTLLELDPELREATEISMRQNILIFLSCLNRLLRFLEANDCEDNVNSQTNSNVNSQTNSDVNSQTNSVQAVTISEECTEPDGSAHTEIVLPSSAAKPSWSEGEVELLLTVHEELKDKVAKWELIAKEWSERAKLRMKGGDNSLVSVIYYDRSLGALKKKYQNLENRDSRA